MRTFKQLVDAISAVQGVPFVEIARAHGYAWPDEPAKRKRLAGDLVEKVLGKDPDARAVPDLTDLDMEVKTIPVGPDLKVLEHTKVTSLNYQETAAIEFERSSVAHKLRNVLFVPVVKYERDDPDRWYVRSPFIWMPSTHARGRLRADYDWVRERLLDGRAGEITSSASGRTPPPYLIPNTSGRDASDTVPYGDVRLKRRAWYLHKTFTARVLEENVTYEPVRPGGTLFG